MVSELASDPRVTRTTEAILGAAACAVFFGVVKINPHTAPTAATSTAIQRIRFRDMEPPVDVLKSVQVSRRVALPGTGRRPFGLDAAITRSWEALAARLWTQPAHLVAVSPRASKRIGS